MANTVHDPVCGMDLDPATGQADPSTKDKLTISARWAARSLSIKTLKNISVTVNTNTPSLLLLYQ
jgi:hypothetical protein